MIGHVADEKRTYSYIYRDSYRDRDIYSYTDNFQTVSSKVRVATPIAPGSETES